MEGAIKQSRKPGGEISFKSRHGNGKRLVERGGGKGMWWGGGGGGEGKGGRGNTWQHATARSPSPPSGQHGRGLNSSHENQTL